MIGLVVLVAFVTTASVFDWRTQRIPNALTYPSALLGLALAGVQSWANDSSQWPMYWLGGYGTIGFFHPVAIEDSLAGLLGIFLLMVFCFVFFSRVGGGDVKVLSTVGAFLGAYKAIEVLLWTFVIQAAFSVIGLIWTNGLLKVVTRSFRQLYDSIRLGMWAPLSDDEKKSMQRPIMLGPAVLLGMVVVLLNLDRYL